MKNNSRPKRSNGMGTLIYKGDGHPYLGRWTWKGKTYCMSTHERDRRKALVALERMTRPFREKSQLEVLQNLQLQIQRQEEICNSLKPNSSLKVSQVFDTWRKMQLKNRISPATMSLYGRYMSNLVDWCLENNLQDVTSLDSTKARDFLVDLSGKVSAAGFNLMVSFYRRVWRALSSEYGLDEGVFKVEKMKDDGTNRRPFTDDELRAIWKAAENDQDLRVLVALGTYSGQRIGDCGCMKWKNVDFERGVLDFVSEKTGAHVILPLHPRLREVLDEVPRNGEYISERNARLHRSRSLSGQFCRFLNGLGIETSTRDGAGRKVLLAGFHSFRHRFASALLDSGASAAMVSKLVGHSTSKLTTETYWHESSEAMKKAVDVLPTF